MIRWLIWSQVAFALVGLLATLADQGRVPPYLFPPQAILLVCGLSTFVCPLAVIISAWSKTNRFGRISAVAASFGLSLLTIYAMFPLVQ